VKQRIKILVAGGVLALILFGAAMAGPLEDGQAAYGRGMVAFGRHDYATALRLWQPLANQGNVMAEDALGYMYETGYGVLQSDATAAIWYRKAADHGDSEAQNSLGAMYENGRGEPQDYALAAMWYRKAADHGNTTAQKNLGRFYENGRGVPQDYVLAHMWFNLAASGFTIFTETHDEAVSARDELTAKMTPSQIAEAQRMAREWLQKCRSESLLGWCPSIDLP
jgi:uncharacterized protein